MNNVFNHANSELGAVACAQALPDDGRIEVAVLDCGVGVQASLRTNPALRSLVGDDSSAIRLALRCEVTSKPDTQTGVGLFFTRKIAVRTGGDFLLHSGDGRGLFEGRRFKSETTAYWHGTCASVRFGLAPVGLRDIFLTYQTATDRALEI
jgi:hypothetical protein